MKTEERVARLVKGGAMTCHECGQTFSKLQMTTQTTYEGTFNRCLICADKALERAFAHHNEQQNKGVRVHAKVATADDKKISNPQSKDPRGGWSGDDLFHGGTTGERTAGRVVHQGGQGRREPGGHVKVLGPCGVDAF